MARDVRFVHGYGGFKLHNWQSNNGVVLEILGKGQLDSDKHINFNDGGKTETVLGML